MTSVGDLRRQIDQIDREMLGLLSRRTKMVKKIIANVEEEEDPEWDEQVLANWLEEGFDYGLEEAPTTKVCNAVMEMGKKSVEI